MITAGDFPPLCMHCGWDKQNCTCPTITKHVDGPELIFASNNNAANFTIDLKIIDANNEVRSLSELYYETPDFTDPDYKFSEGAILDEIKEYIDSTYNGHYAGKTQVLEWIMENLNGIDFLKGNILKYVVRFGKKEGNNRKDILKAIHYLILLLYFSSKSS